MCRLKPLLILLLPLVLSGCFEIIEEIKVHTDGSGNFKYTINFSQSASKIKSLFLLDEVEGYKVPTQQKIQQEFEKVCGFSKKISGLSDVHYSSDFDHYIFTYTCSFKDIMNLNTAVDSIQVSLKATQTEKKHYFAFSQSPHYFERKGDDTFKKAYQKMTDSQRAIFVGAKYTCLYRFDELIDTSSNHKVKIALNRKTAFYKLDMFSVMTRENALHQKIKFK
ncbi:MAG: hypothetical protein WDZ35_01375 [Crocinitomicaceae bacterium]